MQGLRDIFRSDAFVPTTAVFPAIDTAQLASELRLESEGKTRGAMSQPRSEEGGFDVIEQRILERVGDLRRKGIDNYAVNRQAYDKRLTRAGEARKEAEFVAGTAKSDFLAAVKVWKARMATPRTRVTEAYQGLHAYRRRHHLERPAHEPQSMLKWAAIALVLVVVESVLNAGLFAEASALGLVGGVLTALLISVINVACGSLAAYFGRNVNHVNWFRKLLGLGAVLAGIACAGAFNLAVAHFRDAVETLEDWDEAARAAWQSLLSTPLALDSVMSALLIVLGLLITLLAALKTYHSMDPYPGYAKEEASVRRSRAVYADTLTQAIAQLDESRDEAINTLKDVNQQMRIGITEAVDALYGQTSLKSELDRFLEHCDEKANLLLETYRDANRRARPRLPEVRSEEDAAKDVPEAQTQKKEEADKTGPMRVAPPKHFDERYSFPQHAEHAPPQPRRDEAVQVRDQVGDLVSRSIAEIFDEYRSSVDAYSDIEDLETHGGIRTAEPSKAILKSRIGRTRGEAAHSGGRAGAGDDVGGDLVATTGSDALAADRNGIRTEPVALHPRAQREKG
jgi:hypothetical protein